MKKLGFKLVRATMGRKIWAKEAISHLSAPKAAFVTSQTRHIEQTEARHYRAIVLLELSMRWKHCASSQRPPRKSHRKKKRKAFKKEETDIIWQFFKQQISEGRAQTLTQCKDFVSEHRQQLQDRSAKDVQDKVKKLGTKAH